MALPVCFLTRCCIGQSARGARTKRSFSLLVDAPLAFEQPVMLPGKEIEMKNSRRIGGVILMLVAAAIFIFNVTDYSVPAAITLLIVGVALVATARRG